MKTPNHKKGLPRSYTVALTDTEISDVLACIGFYANTVKLKKRLAGAACKLTMALFENENTERNSTCT